ncbi:helix-turn-helix domain-containing protein [Paenibacillus sp. HB172176]|uniref:helix-turn-helix domain-containing protein n=1 Tax=Paenibacillus sp. HB172176 TaxID=2493690 RepID=UPI001439FCE2|nr:helix-turn-helix domain-containing protein [Paenibacillus sp. HB172176]
MSRFLLAGRPMYNMKRRVYRKYLSVLLAVACIPVLILSAVVYFVGTHLVSQEITSIQQKQIVKNASKVEEYFSSIELIASQWSQNELFGSKLKDLEKGYDYAYILQIYNALFTMQGSSPLLKQVYLYLDSSHTMINQVSGVNRIESAAVIDQLHRSLMANESPAYWMNGLGEPVNAEQVPLFVYRLPIDSEQPGAALIFVLDDKALQHAFSELSLSQKGLSLLLDGQSNILMQLYEGEQSEALEQKVISRVSSGLPSVRQEGKIEVGHDDYLLSFGQLSRFGDVWTYVNATSLTEMTRPVTFLSQLLMLLGLAGIAVAIVLSLIASRTVYHPIERMLKLVRSDKESNDAHGDEIRLIEHQWNSIRMEVNQVREKLDEQRPEARAGFLLQLLLGYTNFYDELSLRNRMRRLGWIVDEPCMYRVILFRLEGFSQSSKQFLKGDEQLATFAAANIIDEISGDVFPHYELVNFHDLTVGMLTTEFADHHAGEGMKAVSQMSGTITNAVHSILGMHITIVISKAVRSVAEVPEAFEKCRWMLSQHKPNPSSAIIDAQDYVLEEDQTIHYPFTLEQEIIQALRGGEQDLAALRIEQFCREIEEANKQDQVYYQCLAQLLGTIRSHMLRMGFNPFRQSDSLASYEQLTKLGDAREIVRWFSDVVIAPFLEEMQQRDTRHDHRMKTIVQSIIERVHKDYADDLSLDTFADEHNVNGYTLSRMFRQETGENFIDYLTNLRLETSKRLLAHSETSIQVIAEAVGYRQTYYYRIFKKKFGLTPSQYRAEAQKGSYDGTNESST